MNRFGRIAGLMALQAACCFAPAVALLCAALQTDGRGVPETHIPLSANGSAYYAAQFRFFTPNQANLYVRIARRGALDAAERKIPPSNFRAEIESADAQSDDPDGAWFPGCTLTFPNDAPTWNADGVGPASGAILYGGRNYLVGIQRAYGAAVPDLAKFEMIVRVDEPYQPPRMSGFGVFLTFGSFLSAGIGVALFGRNLRHERILS